MKYLLMTLLIAFIALSFIGRKCEHIFTQVEQGLIKIERTEGSGAVFLGGQGYVLPRSPTGLQEGKELICVKCFHVQKQILDYGEPASTGALAYPGASLLNCCDILNATSASMGAMFLKGDTVGLLKIGDMFLKADTIGWIK